MANPSVVIPSSTVAICGSRSLSLQSAPLVNSVVCSLVSAQRPMSIGCAAGADALAVSAALSAGASSLLSVYAIGGNCGGGFAGNASAVHGVMSARKAGASVVWWAGGPAKVSSRQRLVTRSLACVSSASALVAFVSELPKHEWSGSGLWRSCGSGTWSSVAAAAARGCTVIVFPVGAVSKQQLPTLPMAGTWEHAGSGVWSPAYKFTPNSLI